MDASRRKYGPVVATRAISRCSWAGSRSRFTTLPVAFEPNQGQTNERASYFARCRGYAVFLTCEGVTIRCSRTISLQFLSATSASEWQGSRKLRGIVNYFAGSDAAYWRRNIPTFAQVESRGVYPGITAVCHGTAQGQFQLDFVVEPGANPDVIEFALDSAQPVEITASGDLILRDGGEEVRLRKPVIYQDCSGVRDHVQGGYVISEDGNIRFTLGRYDLARPLVIDPVLVYSTFLGGSNHEIGTAIAVDAAGHAYVAGEVRSLDFPTASAYQPAIGGGVSDGFIAKLNPSGTGLVYSTYIGGRSADRCNAIAVDAEGNAYVAGLTRSSNFPTTPGAYREEPVGDWDAFVTKLNAAGNDLVFSTYLGGQGLDEAQGIAVDASGVYVTGVTASRDFPISQPAQENLAGQSDAFITKLAPDGQSLVFSTFLGGTGDDGGQSIAVDSEGAVYVAGYTQSDDLRTSDNAVQPDFGGGDSDAFAAKLTPAGDVFEYVTYLGGSGSEAAGGSSVVVDQQQAIVLTTTWSLDFPTSNALQPALGGIPDVALVRLAADGASLVFSTYLGGAGADAGHSVALDPQGNIVIAGTAEAGFPTLHPIQEDPGGGSDAFVAILTGDGSKLLFSTLLGGEVHDRARGVAVDPQGGIYVAGFTFSEDFPTTAGAFQAEHAGGDIDVFVAKISRLVYPYEYAALVVSGVQDDPASRRLARGAYATTVNIHNPNPENVVFFKKLALTYPPAEQRPGEIFPIATDTLAPDQTLKTDGDEIAARLFPDGLPAPVIQGFLVIQSEKPLDVTAIYTTSVLDAQGQIAGHSNVHVEQIRERVRQADLSIDKTADIIRREETSDDNFEAEILYTISVRNNGPFAAEEITISDILTAENAEFEVLEVPAPILDPAGTFTVESQTDTEAEISIVIPGLPAGDTAQVEFSVLATYSNGMGVVQLIDRASVSHALIDPSPQDNSVEITTQLWP